MKWEPRYLLVIIGLLCLALAWYSLHKKQEDKIPYADDLAKILPALGGGALALEFLLNLAK